MIDTRNLRQSGQEIVGFLRAHEGKWHVLYREDVGEGMVARNRAKTVSARIRSGKWRPFRGEGWQSTTRTQGGVITVYVRWVGLNGSLLDGDDDMPKQQSSQPDYQQHDGNYR